VAGARLVAIGAEQTVPPGQVEAEIGVGLVVFDRVVHAMHVRRHQNPAQHSVDRQRQADVAVVEHGRGVEQHLENHPSTAG
jgi:hypothetical protein